MRELFTSEHIQRITTTFRRYDLIVIDEVQRIPNIGFAVKILVDNLPDIPVLTSGSSSFGLAGRIGDPLTGSQRILTLYPVAVCELTDYWGTMHLTEQLHDLLIYGTYPEVITALSYDEKAEYLTTLRDSYLLKDILELDKVRASRKLFDLLVLLAHQIGSEVSHNEISNALGIARQTVERYLDLLEKTFVIRRIGGFSRNLRKEVTKSARYYFLDNGIRNAVINNYNPLELRNDVGALWENFVLMERFKKQMYFGERANSYFWRTHDRQEIDHVEERSGRLYAYELKWRSGGTREPKLWRKTYPDSEFQVISPENFLDFVT